MSVVAQPPPAEVERTVDRVAVEEQRLLLHDVSWEAYEAIGEALRDRPALRLTYDRGELELMTTSPRHEFYKRWLGRLIEAIAEELNVPIAPGGNMTFKRQELERGLEPDDCFWIAHERDIRGKLDLDFSKDPPPDLALEIEITRGKVGRMGIYAALRVPEVWRFDGKTLQAHVLQLDGTYRVVDRSPTFPAVPLEGIVRFLQPSETMDYLSVIRAFRGWVREQMDSSAATKKSR